MTDFFVFSKKYSKAFRNLDIIFNDSKIDIKTEKFIGQFGLVTFTNEVSEVAGEVFSFAKDREVRIFGGYDLEEMAN